MFGDVTALVGLIYIGEIQEQKHAAHMLQACGLGSSQTPHGRKKRTRLELRLDKEKEVPPKLLQLGRLRLPLHPNHSDTLNPMPQTPHPKLQTLNHKP